ncbi:MAG: hypothetical protein R3F35_09590 [Myxococcota bacterium]
MSLHPRPWRAKRPLLRVDVIRSLRPRRMAPIVLLLLLSSAPQALAQLTIGGGTLARTETNVVTNELSRHLPAAGVRKYSRYVGFLRWETTHTLSIFAETRQGISSRTWKSDTRRWSDWYHHGNPLGAPIQRISGSGDSPGIDTGIAILPGWSPTFSDWSVYQGVARPSTNPMFEVDFQSGLHQLDPVSRTTTIGQSRPGFATASGGQVPFDFRHFDPQASLSMASPVGAARSLRHVYGTAVPRGHVRSSRFNAANVPLVELRREHDTAPQWIDHGRPPGVDGVAVGPGSATSILHDYLNAPNAVDREEQRYVFVATNPVEDGYGEGLNGDEVFYRRGNSQGETWNALGSAGGLVYGAPLAIPYYTGVPIAGGLGRIVVFATVRDGNGRYVLKSRFHDGHGWDAQWAHWGAPTGLGGDKFKLTSAVVWWNGTPNQMANLRINAFGYSEENGSRAGQLVEFHWDGGAWRFATPRTAPDGQSFRTSHAAVIDEGTRDRIVVVGRTSTGRIYEFAREIESGQIVSERWTDLSSEPITILRAGF